MPQLGPVDLVLTDPPYGTTACKWDSIIPLEPMWEQLKRVIKKNGAIVLTASQPFTSALISSNMRMFKYEWIWCKNRPTNFAHAKNKPMKKHENILIFSGGTTVHASQSVNRMPYYPQGVVSITPKKVEKSQNEKTDAFFADRPGHRIFTRDKTGYPNTLIKFSTDQLGQHPTQKPVPLMEYLINTYTNEGETVLDFTIGSGTTAVACENLNRKWIGIEISEKYCELSAKRIERETKQMKLF